MKCRILVLLLTVNFGLSCGSSASSGNLPVNRGLINTNSNISVNSNISNVNLANRTNEMTSSANPDLLRQIEEQQKEDKRLTEEKMRNSGKNQSNANSPVKQAAPKGNQQTF